MDWPYHHPLVLAILNGRTTKRSLAIGLHEQVSFDETEEYSGRICIQENGRESAKISAEFKNQTLGEGAKSSVLTRLRVKLKEMTQVTMDIEAVPKGSLPRFEYKVRRWTDERLEGLERVRYREKSPLTEKH